jgi:CubicO group peptidase (beta-lactamase class C family)
LGCNAGNAPGPTESFDVASFGRQLREFVRRTREAAGVPGIGVGVSIAGRRIFAHDGVASAASAAPLTPQTRFHLGCVTKFLTAAVALEQARLGSLDLSAPIAEYLPDLEQTPAGRRVRLEHLLSHTSGYQGLNVLDPRTHNLNWDSFVAYLRRAPQFFAPGSVFSYEHSETVLLARIVQRVTSLPCSESIARDVLAPLGFGIRARRTEAFAADHAFDSNTRRFRAHPSPAVPAFWRAAFSDRTLSLRELLTLGEAAAGTLRCDASADEPLSAATHRRLRTPVVHLPPAFGGPLSELLPVAFGLGAAVLRGGFYGHTGITAGQSLGLRYEPAARLAVVAGLNARLPQLRDLLLSAVCRSLTGRPSAPDEPTALSFEPAALAGRYRGPGDAAVDVAARGRQLVCEIGAPARGRRLRATLTIRDDGTAVLDCPAPQVSLGFFVRGGAAGLMLGLSAYKRV